MYSDGRALRCASAWVEKLEFVLCFVDRAPLYNLVNKANLVHSKSNYKVYSGTDGIEPRCVRKGKLLSYITISIQDFGRSANLILYPVGNITFNELQSMHCVAYRSHHNSEFTLLSLWCTFHRNSLWL
jgi:hypothetical protein